MSQEFDLIVIGAGPGGYIAAERAGAAGLKVWSDDWTFIESGGLKEKVDSYYAMVNFDMEWGNVPVSGNFGIRQSYNFV